jgi:hypothetical protein
MCSFEAVRALKDTLAFNYFGLYSDVIVLSLFKN